jgi:hypothetical protein
LLYCATSAWPHSPDRTGYLGCHIECFGGIQLPAFKELVRAINNLPIELIVKSHIAEHEAHWKALIKNERISNRIIFSRHSADMFQLLTGADAMILGYWSTALIESAICRIPTIYMHFNNFHSTFLREYTQNGFCRIVSSPPELRRALEELCSPSAHGRFVKTYPENDRLYFLGPQNAQNSASVTSYIIDNLDKNPELHKTKTHSYVFN